VTYTVKEIFKTLQGEGAQAGRASVFCRFSGCNLWTGREADRHKAVCQFCDTDFVGTDGQGGGKFATQDDLVAKLVATWTQDLAPNDDDSRRYVVFTGGEPLLQIDEALIAAVKRAGFEIAIETNGTIAPPHGIDWICVSPKAGAPLELTSGNELKLVFPQPTLHPEQCQHLAFDHFFLQPMDGPMAKENTAAAVNYCLAHPRWRLSVQTHKFIGID
jgi:7-carboxy-7-deazaguanine synthase (Cx14CxxC type)